MLPHAPDYDINGIKEFFIAAVTFAERIHREAHLRQDTDNIGNDVSDNSSIAAVIRFRGNVSIEPLPSNDRWR
jgi:hypothetical protein